MIVLPEKARITVEMPLIRAFLLESIIDHYIKYTATQQATIWECRQIQKDIHTAAMDKIGEIKANEALIG